MRVDASHEVPYAGGVSKNGETIYIDHRIPETYKQTDGKEVRPRKYLVAHEGYEWKLMEHGSAYNAAHRKAAQYEKALLQADDVDVREYYDLIYKHVHLAVVDIDRKKLPEDLDLRPYIQDGLSHTLDAMGYHGQVKQPRNGTKAFLDEEKKKDIEF
jgi:hypothetical protein